MGDINMNKDRPALQTRNMIHDGDKNVEREQNCLTEKGKEAVQF